MALWKVSHSVVESKVMMVMMNLKRLLLWNYYYIAIECGEECDRQSSQ
jgi:hypothetical protein